jgi:hypothetical protein
MRQSNQGADEMATDHYTSRRSSVLPTVKDRSSVVVNPKAIKFERSNPNSKKGKAALHWIDKRCIGIQRARTEPNRKKKYYEVECQYQHVCGRLFGGQSGCLYTLSCTTY